jgi:hemerythrin superfamily protein
LVSPLPIRCLLALPSKDDDGQSEQEDIKKQSEKKADAYNVRRLEELITKTKDPSKMMNQVLSFNKINTLHEISEQQCVRAINRVEEILRTT